MRICIVGAGYLGSALATEWKKQGAHVTVTTTTQSRVEFLKSVADRVWLLDHSGLVPWGEELAACDAVMVTVAPKSRSLEAYRVCYVETIKNVIAASLVATTFPHLFYTSSTSVYGEWNGADVTETTLPSALDPYATLLYQSEQILLRAREEQGLRVTLLRLGEIIGPGRELENRLKRGHNKPFPGDGTRFVNVSHLHAILEAIAFCYTTGSMGVYNLCSSAHPTRLELYQTIAKREGLPLPLWDPQLQASHQGNKRVLSRKIAEAGFCYPEEPL